MRLFLILKSYNVVGYYSELTGNLNQDQNYISIFFGYCYTPFSRYKNVYWLLSTSTILNHMAFFYLFCLVVKSQVMKRFFRQSLQLSIIIILLLFIFCTNSSVKIKYFNRGIKITGKNKTCKDCHIKIPFKENGVYFNFSLKSFHAVHNICAILPSMITFTILLQYYIPFL